MEDRHQIKPYPLRMPPDVRAGLEAEASASGRSLHAEILLRLAMSLTGGATGARLLTDKDIAEIVRRICPVTPA